MFFYLKEQNANDTSESGFVLVLSLIVLLLLSLLGIWALNTATSELDVAGGLQQVERQFNLAEGAANSEAGKVGFFLQPFYQISNPSIPNQLLIPSTDATFDPGNDTVTTLAGITAGDSATWPWENLLQNYDNLPANTNEFDYRYLSTYLYPDTAPMGYDPNSFSGYKFRVQGCSPLAPTVVELGGTKVGVKAVL
ncbi:MAG: PilX N-terminal domain-containing pilus assembly protein [Pseudomonadota bacterium]